MTRSTLFLFALLMWSLCGFARADAIDRPIQDDVIYFVLPDRFFNADTANDRGGYQGDKFSHGFDPTDKAFYHGGDLKGLTAKLDYLKEMGITAIWMGPIFKNKPVQGDSAGYHGYWTIDFTKVDSHFGTNEDLKTLVKEAHRRGMKVFFDIIVNHTADVIKYREADESASKGAALYRNKVEYPYTTVGGSDGTPINEGFQGDSVQTKENFAKLTEPRWAYTPYVPEKEKNIKVPSWLNDPIYYHNRGESTFSGENSQFGDFFGLDDLFTENPKVVEEMIEIFKLWIREFKIDGFRLDTVKHVNIGFWQQFAPAIIAYGHEQGLPQFFVFGEVYDATPEVLSIYTTEGRLPAVLDFGFQAAAAGFVSDATPTDNLKGFFEKDDYYIDADSDVYSLPTFIGNHDMGRIGYFIQRGGSADEDEMLRRSRLAHALMYFARGIPVIYYGDEQGFTGDGLDQDAREDMFPSQVAGYNDNNLLGTDATTAADNFDTTHPLYKTLGQFGEIRRSHEPLRSGIQVHRYSGEGPGIYAFSRIDPNSRQEYVLAFNNDTKAHSASFKTYATGSFSPVYPAGGKPIVAGDTLTLEVPPLNFVILKADQPIPRADAAPAVRFASPADGGLLIEDQFVSVDLSEDTLAEVNLEAKIGDGEFEPLGRDTNPPYRVFFKIGEKADGTPVTFRATASDYAGKTQTAEIKARIDTRLPHLAVTYQNGNGRDSVYAISSTGEIILPQALANGRFDFDWPERADGVTLFFETREGADFRFDEPIYLSLAEVVSQSQDKDGKLVASIQISTRPPLDIPPAAEPPLAETVHIRGGMNTWKDTHPLDYAGNNTYHTRVELPAGWTEFKFADATWKKLNVGAPFGPDGATRSSSPGNLRLRVPEGQGGLYDVWFFALPKDGGHYFFYRFEPLKTP
ncbi:MAG TPA: alpha-amylase family glycosyl hydrolase [Terrimicrobiaceae bacterium]